MIPAYNLYFPNQVFLLKYIFLYLSQQQRINYTEAIISAVSVFGAYLLGTLIVLLPYYFQGKD